MSSDFYEWSYCRRHTIEEAEILFLVFEHLHIFRFPEKIEVIENVFGILAHCLFLALNGRIACPPGLVFWLRLKRGPLPSARPDC